MRDKSNVKVKPESNGLPYYAYDGSRASYEMWFECSEQSADWAENARRRAAQRRRRERIATFVAAFLLTAAMIAAAVWIVAST